MSEPGQLVRSYSIELENTLSSNTPASDVRRIFIENERRLEDQEARILEWRKHYEPWSSVPEQRDPITKALREQGVLLSYTWQLFRESIPNSEREELEGTIPSLEGLVGMVGTVANEWQDKRGKSRSGKYMKHFTSFCETLEAHSYMLEILPSGSQYVSLFMGTLKTILTVTSNYEKIARGLGEALSKISVHVIACEKEVRLHQTKAIQEKIANLYAHVFLFLADTMKWYLKKPRLQLRDAFREHFYEHFENIIVAIQDHSSAVLREASLISMADMKQTKLNTEEILREVRLGKINERLSSDRAERERAEMKYQHEQFRIEIQREREERKLLERNASQRKEMFGNNLFLRIAAAGIRQELLNTAQKALDDQRFRYTTTKTRQQVEYGELMDNSAKIALRYERDSIILASNHLLDVFSPSNLQSPYEPHALNPISLDTAVASRLKNWTTSTTSKSQLITIAGRRPKGLEPPPMSILATMCVDLAAAANLPVISYFVSLPPQEELRDGNSREVQALISLAYALIRQLIERLPMQFSSPFDFDQERLLLLNGTMKSWAEAIRLLKDLERAVPKPLFCIVDDFQLLDDWSTKALLKDLVEALGDKEAKNLDAGVLKVLITTTGRSRALMKFMEAGDILLADRDGAVDSPARRGGNSRFTF